LTTEQARLACACGSTSKMRGILLGDGSTCTGERERELFHLNLDTLAGPFANAQRSLFSYLWFSVGSYVRVIGNMRSFIDARSVLAFRVMPITDYNEVTYHFLDVIHVHLAVLKGELVRHSDAPPTQCASRSPAHQSVCLSVCLCVRATRAVIRLLRHPLTVAPPVVAAAASVLRLPLVAEAG
jgi:hypothetical protein